MARMGERGKERRRKRREGALFMSWSQPILQFPLPHLYYFFFFLLIDNSLSLVTLQFRAYFPGGFPGGSDGKEPACNMGDLGSLPGLGRCPGEGNGNPLHCSCLENSMDGGAWWAMVHGVTMNWTPRSD